MNPEVKKIFVLFNELIQNQSDNILSPPRLKSPNSNSRAFLRNKPTNRRPSKYQYILTFEDLLKLKETDIVDSCDKVIGHCANHSGSPGFKVYLNKTMLFSVWTYQELADASSIFEDNVKKRLKVVCGELSASSENAFKLYNFLNKGERKHIKVNGILLDKIKEKYLRFYLSNICGRTSLYFDETMFRNIKPDEQWIIINENDKCLGYIQNIPNYNTKYYIFIEKKLLLTVNLWPEVEKFISGLDKSIMDSIRISHHPNWNGICWNSIKDEKCYMLIYDDDEILFKSEGSSIPFRSDEYWNEVEVVDFKNNLKQIAKLKREINEYCTKYAKDS